MVFWRKQTTSQFLAVSANEISNTRKIAKDIIITKWCSINAKLFLDILIGESQTVVLRIEFDYQDEPFEYAIIVSLFQSDFRCTGSITILDSREFLQIKNVDWDIDGKQPVVLEKFKLDFGKTQFFKHFFATSTDKQSDKTTVIEVMAIEWPFAIWKASTENLKDQLQFSVSEN